MEQVQPEWHKLKCYMETEKILLTSFSETNKNIRNYVRDMDWPTLECRLRDLDDLSCQIQEMDRRRHRLLKKIKKTEALDNDQTFFSLTSPLAEPVREELRSLHNSLKILSEQVKIEGRITSAYVEARQQSLKDMLGELIPETRHLFYGPSGRTFKGSTGTSSLLVNRSL